MAETDKPVEWRHITKNPRVCGGKACIDDTRIRVIDIIELQREGLRPAEMQDVFAVHLSLAQIHSALGYGHEHREEIEADFRAGSEAEAAIARARAEYLEKRSGL